jgi:RNA polymerase sigma-70 factor (ECF subfamily)
MKLRFPGRKPEAAASGNGAAGFEELYRQFFRPVYAFIAYRVNDRAQAEDVTSQVFEKAWRAFPGYDPARASAGTWIFTIARNCVTDHYRRRQARREEPLGERQLADQKTTAADDPEPEPASELTLQMRQELTSALTGLSEREYEIIALKFGGGRSNQDIGRLLELSAGNVGTILYRSLQKLKTQLEGVMQND